MVPVNYLAVLLVAIINIVLGGLWYGPFFGKPWMAMMGVTPESMAGNKDKMRGMMARSYSIMAIGALIMSLVLAHFLIFGETYLGVSGFGAGLQVGFWSWLGFVAPVTVGTVLWEGKPWKLWFINAGYYLVALLIGGVILSLWI